MYIVYNANQIPNVKRIDGYMIGIDLNRQFNSNQIEGIIKGTFDKLSVSINLLKDNSLIIGNTYTILEIEEYIIRNPWVFVADTAFNLIPRIKEPRNVIDITYLLLITEARTWHAINKRKSYMAKSVLSLKIFNNAESGILLYTPNY